MEARALMIEEKLRTFGASVAKPSNFRLRDGGAVNPRILLQDPNLSLYCLDFENGQALFVETPPECDLSRAPFVYQAQYESALRLVQVPYDTFHKLASEVAVDPSRLILVYSVGRCGSTLVSRAFGEARGVDSISEPDVFTQLVGTWDTGDRAAAENAELLRSCAIMQCVPGRLRGASSWTIKFRSMVTDLGDLFYSVFPAAKIIFLYRDAGPWARSFLRLMGTDDPTAQFPLAPTREHFGRIVDLLASRETASSLELVTCMWLAVMEKCLEMQRQGIPMLVVRYEELAASPHAVLSRMFAYCGIPPDAAGNLDTVLREDSQAGTPLSRAALEARQPKVTEEHVEAVRRLVREYSMKLKADTILPGTYFPPAGSA